MIPKTTLPFLNQLVYLHVMFVICLCLFSVYPFGKKLMTSKICVNTTKPEKQYNISVGALVNPVANEATEPKVFSSWSTII